MGKNKKVLFIAPTFFNYYKEIKKELENQNFEVDYFADIPSNSNFQKALGRINRKLIKKSVEKYFYDVVYENIKVKKYDYVFIIVGMTFSFFPEMIEKIKEINKKAKFILYQWDGEENIKFVKDIQQYFDRIFTFDRIDCENNGRYQLLPLFYTKNYEKVGVTKKENYEYDISYIGTAHPQKLKMIDEMSEELRKIYPKQFIYHYMPSKLKYFYHKFFSKEYKKIKMSDLNFRKLSFDETMKVFENSKCILDAPQKGQNGLTMRTIECLGAKRKLITTNQDIVNYDFYNKYNIYVYTGKIDLDDEFFKSEYKELQQDIYEKYSLKNWLKTMFIY